MRKHLRYMFVLLSLILVFHLAACDDDNEGDSERGSNVDVVGYTDNTIIENYVYLPEQIELRDFYYHVHGATVHNDQLFFYYIDSASAIAIVGLSVDGSLVDEIHIPAQEGLIYVGGLEFTDDGHFFLIKVRNDDNGNIIATYGKYSLQGEAVYTQDLAEMTSRNTAFSRVEQVVRTDDGNIAIVIWVGSHSDIHLFDSDGTSLGLLEIDLYTPNASMGIAKIEDGRVLALQRDGESRVLREIDFAAGDWGETLPLGISNAIRLLPADSFQPYDLMIDDGSFIIGYTLETAVQTPLFSWMEAALGLVQNYHIGFTYDGHAFVINEVSALVGESMEWGAEIFLLTRTMRTDMPIERTVLTMGGVSWLFDEIRREIMEFNSENQYYQIELRDYGIEENWEVRILRFQVEMVAGLGPDIIFDLGGRNINSTFMVDLYTLIDADPVLDRSDFFPNIMQLLEAPDGTLPAIGNHFSIHTWLALRETATQIEPFTFDNLHNMIDESDAFFLFGDWMSRLSLLSNAIHYSGAGFIDWENNRANLDSESFIRMLEIAASLPDNDEIYARLTAIRPEDSWDAALGEFSRVRRGEQLFYTMPHMSDPNHFREYQAILGDIVAVGMPTYTGGQHALGLMDLLGINAGSQHQQAAWSFVRRFLLSEYDVEFQLPLRIDSFDRLIAEAMTPDIWRTTDPETGAVAGEERPRELWYEGLELYAMTEEEAAHFRSIVDSVSMRGVDSTPVWMIVREGAQDFFAGIRTVEDTVRIMQSRVQLYLSERE